MHFENYARRNGLFRDVPDELWNDWHWQVKNRVETLEDLKKYVNLTEEEEEGVRRTLGRLRMAITPYYLSLIDLNDKYDPIRRQAIPTAHELESAPYEAADPLHEDTDSPVKGLTHRYPDRVLRTGCCSWSPTSAPCTAATAPAGASPGRRTAPCPWSRSKSASSTSGSMRRSGTCSSPAATP